MSAPSPAPPQPLTPGPPTPVRRPVLRQGWRDLAFVHWSYEPDQVARLLPAGIRLDTFEGRAWVGLVPFVMTGVRPPGVPTLGPLGTFPEVNVRTYVLGHDGRRSVWFFSLDVPDLAPTAVARVGYALPYCWGRVTVEVADGRMRSEVQRRWPRRPPATSRLELDLGPALAPGETDELDHFLTARWGLVTSRRGRIREALVDHPAWPLHRASVVELDDTLVAAAGLPPPTDPPRVLASPGVDVTVSRPRLVGRARR